MFLIPKFIRGILARLTFPFYIIYLATLPKRKTRNSANWQTWQNNFQEWKQKWQSF